MNINNITKVIETNLSLTTFQYNGQKILKPPQYMKNEGGTGLQGSSLILNKPCLQ